MIKYDIFWNITIYEGDLVYKKKVVIVYKKNLIFLKENSQRESFLRNRNLSFPEVSRHCNIDRVACTLRRGHVTLKLIHAAGRSGKKEQRYPISFPRTRKSFTSGVTPDFSYNAGAVKEAEGVDV